MQAYTEAWSAEAARLLQLLPGVFAARFLTDETGEKLEAIHILAHSKRGAKQVVRDVQAALSAAYGLDVDHRIVSVAQMPVNPILEEAAEEAVDPPVSARVQYAGLGYEEISGNCSVAVTLRYGGENYRGEAQGRAGSKWRDHLTAQATVAAVNQLLGGENAYALLSVQRVQTPVTLLAVALVQAREDEKVLTGAAVLEDGSLHGLVRSTLDAINRNLMWRLMKENERKRVHPINTED